MILPALALLSVSIDGGPMNKVLAQLRDAVNGPDKVDILYGFDDVRTYKSAGVRCQRCTPEQIMTQVLRDTPLFWNIDGDDGPGIVITVCVSAADCESNPPKPCRPELGAQAPLPPCTPKPRGVYL